VMSICVQKSSSSSTTTLQRKAAGKTPISCLDAQRSGCILRTMCSSWHLHDPMGDPLVYMRPCFQACARYTIDAAAHCPSLGDPIGSHLQV
jgi:hypothetical protein